MGFWVNFKYGNVGYKWKLKRSRSENHMTAVKQSKIVKTFYRVFRTKKIQMSTEVLQVRCVCCVVSRFSHVWPCECMVYSPSRLPCPKDSPGTNIGVGCHALLQGIFSIQGLKLCLLSLLYWQVSSLLESPEVKVKAVQSCLTLCEPMDGSPWNSPGQNTGVGSLPLFQCIFPIQESNQGLLHCRWVLPTEPSGSYLGSLFTFKPEELFK